MPAQIHPSAVVSPQASIASGVVVGPWCVVDAHASLDSGVVLESRVRVYGGTTVGANTRDFDGAILGADPQDLKYAGQDTTLNIGENCIIREYSTLNRGTKASGSTQLGSNVLVMAYTHIAHDCIIADECVLANKVQLGGHVSIGRGTVLGGGVYVQQFSRIGAYSFVGGTQKVERHIAPFSKALGDPLCWAGLNLHGLRRAKLEPKRQKLIRRQLRDLYRGSDTVKGFLQANKRELDPYFAEFFQNWQGGLLPKSS